MLVSWVDHDGSIYTMKTSKEKNQAYFFSLESGREEKNEHNTCDYYI